jgi:hypothetical protein
MKRNTKIKIALLSLPLLFAFSNSAFAAPTVSTQAASNVNATFTTLNGSLDDLGGSTISQHGFVCSSTDPDPAIVPSVTPILQYKMNDNDANTTVTDSIGTNTGTSIQNTSVMTTSGKINSAFNFNGTSDYIYSTTQYSNPQSFTISVWFKTSSASGKKIIGFESNRSGTASSSYDRQIWIGTDGKAYFGWYTGAMTTIVSQNTVIDGNWHQAIATLNASSASFYIDGQLQGTGSGTAQSYSGYWRVGSYKNTWTNGSDGYFTGQLDDVRIYSSALSTSDINILYSSVTEKTAGSPSINLGTKSGTGSFSTQFNGLLPNTLYYCRSFAKDANNISAYGNVVSFTTTNSGYTTWVGGTSSEWSTGSNWSSGSAPDSGTEVVINGDGSNAPTLDLSGGTTTIKALSLGSTNASTLTFSNGDSNTKKLVVTEDVGIGVNGTLTHTANATTETHKLNIEAANFSIASGGKIDTSYKGYRYSAGPCKGADGSSAGGAGHGGSGGTGSTGAGGAACDSLTQPTQLGSGGGSYSSYYGGSGGGAIKLSVTGTLNVLGGISANGASFSNYYSGGGAGGSIYITAGTLLGNNTISAYGGSGHNWSAGGGAGGIIAVYYTTDSSSITYQAYGGYRDAGYTDRMGGVGTIFKKSSAQANGDLVIDNNNRDSSNDSLAGKTTLNDTYTFDNLTLQNYGNLLTGTSSDISYTNLNWTNNGILTDLGGTYYAGSDFTIPQGARLVEGVNHTYNNLVINGILTHIANTTAETYKLDITVNGNLTIGATGSINVDNKGYQAQAGTGAGTYERGGGSYGGKGAKGNSSGSGGITYGSINQPNNIGSGGGGDGCGGAGGRGAGAVKLTVSGTTNVLGTISAKGEDGTGGCGTGGGSGGSIWISTGDFSGNGIISANGGEGGTGRGGGGGGGRIALHYTADSSAVTFRSYGGGGFAYGGAGTIFKKSAAQANGDLLIDNNDHETFDLYVGKTTINTSGVFDAITIQNYGNLETGASTNISYSTFNWSNEGIITDNGGVMSIISGGGSLNIPQASRLVENTNRTFSGLVIDGTLTHSANTAAETYKLDVTLNGDLTLNATGSINVDSKGYQSQSGSGAGAYERNGAGYGGNGARGSSTGNAGSAYGSISQPNNIGSGGGGDGCGGAGGRGAGSVKLTASGETNILGNISAKGADGSGGCGTGGGSGGSIWIVTGTLSGNGNLFAKGGVGGGSYRGGSGGGGRIAVYYTTDNSSTISYQAYGGAGSYPGGAGTVFKKSAAQSNGDLIINNNSQNGANTPNMVDPVYDNISILNSGKFDITSTSASISLASVNMTCSSGYFFNAGTTVFPASYTTPSCYFSLDATKISGLSNLTVASGTTFETRNLTQYAALTLSNLIVKNGGTVTHNANSTAQTHTLNLSITNDLTVENGGTINANGKGYSGGSNACQVGYGSGGGNPGTADNQGGGGAGHGNTGGAGQAGGTGGSSYDSLVQPVLIGSGGGGGGDTSCNDPTYDGDGGAGGGAARINVSGTTTIDGTLSADGSNGTDAYYSWVGSGGGGSGGSIWLTVNLLEGTTGSITSKGGNGATYSADGGGGAGGRIVVEYGTNNSSISQNLSGGTGFVGGNTGTYRAGSLNGNIISSPYNSSSAANIISHITWTENLPSGTDAKFQIRTASDSSGSPGTWTEWMGPTGTSDYFTNPSGSETMNPTFGDLSNDQWFQYKAVLTSNDLSVNPTVSDVTITYVVNSPPEFDTAFGTNGVTINQISNSGDSNWGKVKIDYSFKDIDSTTGTNTPNYITPTFEYSLDGGSHWADINLADVTFASAPPGGEVRDINSDGKIDHKVLEGSYLTYTAYWSAKNQIPENYSNNFQIRVAVNDNEAANNIIKAIGNTASLDVKTPGVGTHPILVDASASPANLTLSSTDDSTLRMNTNLSNTFPAVLSTTYSDSATISLLTNPDTVYVRFQDIYGNTTQTYSTTTPETPTGMMIQDTSNMRVDPHEYRLFTAWKVADIANPPFAEYQIFRSSNNVNFSLLNTMDSRTINYYGDSTTVYNQHYYYKIAMKDANGNISYFSQTIDGKANGVQDAGEGGGGSLTAPQLFNVQISNVTTSSATVTWDTDVLANSTVGYSDTAGVFSDEIGVNSFVVNNHMVTLFGLDSGTHYYLQAKSMSADNVVGTDDNGGDGYTFTTVATDDNPPTISNISSGVPGFNSADITWDTDENSTSFIEFSENNGFTQGDYVGNYNMTSTHSVLLNTLSANNTYYYKIHTTDASGNERISSQNSFATSSDPHDYDPPVISFISSGTPPYNTATVTWTTDENADSFVEYGLTTSYGRIVGLEDSTMNHSITLPTNLLADNTYHFRVRSRDASNNLSISDDYTFQTATDPHDYEAPTISNVAVTNATQTTATVTWTTNENSDSYIGYSQDFSYTNDQGKPALTASHSITLVGLSPSTLYHFQVKSSDASGNLATDSNSGNYNFSTDSGIAPPVISGTSSSVGSTTATVTWTTDLNSNSFVEYGTDIAYGLATGKYDSTKNHSVTLSGLSPSTTYHFRMRSKADTEGVSGDYTLTTAPGPDTNPPIISDISSSNITDTGARISCSTDKDTSFVVEYGTTASYNQRMGTDEMDGLLHYMMLDSLTDGTTYHYRIIVKDASGNETETADQTFTTLSDTTAPEISGVSVEVISNTQAVITWKTDELSSSEISYGKNSSLTDSSIDAVTDKYHHTIILSTLESDTEYSFKARSRDNSNNVGESDISTFKTLKDPVFHHDPLSLITNVSDPPSVVVDTKAVITWNTDQPSNSVVEFGTISGSYNELPITNNNLDTHHSVTLASLLPQTTYYFKVSSEDNLQNSISSKEYSFTTLPKQVNEEPVGVGSTADTTSPSISNTKTSSATANSVTISWNTNEDSDGKIRYGLDNNYGQAAAEDITVSDPTKFTTTHAVIINGLLSNTSYNFMVVSTDLAGNIGQSGNDTFKTSAIAALSGVSITNITLNSAVVTWETANPTTSVIEYGSTTSYGKSASNKTNTNTHKIELTGLSAGQTYHLRVNGLDKNSNNVASDDYVFATYATPQLETYKVEEVTDSLVKLTWSTNVPTDSMVEYTNKTSGESSAQGTLDTTADHAISVTNLEPGTEYEAKIKGTDVNKNSFMSNPFVFTTAADTQSPDISQVKTESSLISGKEDKVQSIIFWKTNESSTSQVKFEEGVTISDTFSQESREDNNLTTNHIIVLTNLKPGTVYHFRVVSKDESSNEAISENFTLLTPQKSQSIIQLIVSNFEQTFGWLRKLRS